MKLEARHWRRRSLLYNDCTEAAAVIAIGRRLWFNSSTLRLKPSVSSRPTCLSFGIDQFPPCTTHSRFRVISGATDGLHASLHSISISAPVLCNFVVRSNVRCWVTHCLLSLVVINYANSC